VTNGDVYEKTGASAWTVRANLAGPAGPTGPTGSGVVAPEAWRSMATAGQPAFQNGWGNYGTPFGDVKFRKHPNGWVEMKGVMKNGTIGTVPAFTMPTGYRPTENQIHIASATNGSGRVDINPTGELQVVVATATYVSLSGMFYATD
jgi:hypothetical protein